MKTLIYATLLVALSMRGQEVLLTPAQQLSKTPQDNEIIIGDNRYEIFFRDRLTKDTCATFDLKAHNPYYVKGLKYNNLSGYTADEVKLKVRNGVGRYDIKGLSRKEVIRMFKLYNTPAPIPPDYIFESVFIGGYVYEIKGDKAIISYFCKFSGRENGGGHSGELLLANRSTFLVLNNQGEVLWQIKHIPADANADLTTNGRYIGICYGNFAEDYTGNYYGKNGTWIYDLDTNEKILDQAFSAVGVGLGERDNIFGLHLGATHRDSITLCALDVEKRTIYTLTVNEKEYSSKASRPGEYKNLESGRGFIWKGKTYNYDKDFKQTPFHQPLKIR
ncbi:MAG: hypothetical protein IPL35_02830 [Sphingobacteriales bacterium]|nr:hypothetical protein [Sphingobacteriales bacterium]